MLTIDDYRNIHLDQRDRELFAERSRAFQARAGDRPRVGDFVEIEGKGLHRVCHSMKASAQTTAGGRFHIDRDGLADYSGSLDCPKVYERFQPTDREHLGEFWFFHHGLPGASRGVSCWIPCKVFRLIDLEWTEAQARAHPSLAGMIDFWGADHPDVARAVARLMSNPR